MNGWLTTQQAADRLGVSQGRVRQLILSGDLPAEKMGRDRMIREEDLELVKGRPGRGRPKKKEAA
jgi:excisionase family DNA binding protein